MKHVKMVVIFPTYEDVETVKKTLPTVMDECARTGSGLIIHDASVDNREEMWAYLRSVTEGTDAFLILTSAVSMAVHAIYA